MVVGHYCIIVLGVLVAVSFYTLFERKMMGLTHLRPGPQLVSSGGLLQPLADAMKLFTKEGLGPSCSNRVIFMAAPSIMLSLSIAMWSVVPLKWGLFSFKMLVVGFFILTSVSVFTHLGSGWSSNSAYSLIGALRCVAQTLSYECCTSIALVKL